MSYSYVACMLPQIASSWNILVEWVISQFCFMFSLLKLIPTLDGILFSTFSMTSSAAIKQ